MSMLSGPIPEDITVILLPFISWSLGFELAFLSRKSIESKCFVIFLYDFDPNEDISLVDLSSFKLM